MGVGRGGGRRKAAGRNTDTKSKAEKLVVKGKSAKGKAAQPRLTAGALASHAMAHASGASGSDAVNSVTKGVCYNCNVKRSEKDPFPTKVDFACAACWAPYPAAFSHHGTFIEFVDKKSKDEQLQEQYLEARRVLEKKQAPCWQATAVEDADEVTIKHSMSLIGPSRADLVVLLEGTTPEELGVKLETLEHPDGSTYKGLLMPDPQCPWPRYEISVSKSAKKRQTRMDPASQVFAAQADEAMKFVRKEKIEQPKFSNMLLTKMRTMPWTLEALASKAGAHRSQTGKPSLTKLPALLGASSSSQPGGALCVAGSAADQEESEPEDDDEGEEEEDGEGSDIDGVVAAASGVMMNSTAVLDSMSAVGGAKPSLKRKSTGLAVSEGSTAKKSPGAKAARVKMDANGLPVHDSDRQDLVGRRIFSADIGKILSGAALGREVRWCRDSRDLFRAVNENKFADALEEHHSLCKRAETLAESPLGKLGKAELEICVKELQDAGYVLPDNMQGQLYQRRLAEIIAQISPGVVDDFMSLILPWSTASGEKTPETFDGLRPKLALMSCTVEDKGSMFLSAACDAIARLMKGGLEEKENVLNVSDRIMKYMQEQSDSEDAMVYDSYVDKLLLMTRTVKTIGDATCTMYFASIPAFEQVCGKKHKTKEPALNAFYLALKSSEHWWGMFLEHKDKGESSQKHLDDIARYQQLFHNKDTFMTGGEFLSMLKAFPVYFAECRPALYGSLQHSAEQTLCEQVGKWSEKGAFDLASPSCAADLATARAVLQEAVSALPKYSSKWSEGLQMLLRLEASLCKEMAMTAFRDLAQKATKETWGNEQERCRIMAATQKLAQSETAASDERGEVLKSLCKSALSFVASSCVSGSAAELVLEVVGAMQSATSFPKLEKYDADMLSMAKAWRPLELAVKEFNDLGESLVARVAAASSKSVLTKLASACAQAGENAEVLKDFQCLADGVGKAKQVLEEAFREMLVAATAAVESSKKSLEANAKGGLKGESWTKGITEAKALDITAVVAVAKKSIMKIKGKEFEELVTGFRNNIDYMAEVYQLFGKEWAATERKTCDDMYYDCMVTKMSGMLLYEYAKDEAEPNPTKLRRAIRSLRKRCADYSKDIQPGLWQWSGRAENF